jgi:hypothetical protein
MHHASDVILPAHHDPVMATQTVRAATGRPHGAAAAPFIVLRQIAR